MREAEEKIAREQAERDRIAREKAEQERMKQEQLQNEIVEKHSPKKEKFGKIGDSASESGFSNM